MKARAVRWIGCLSLFAATLGIIHQLFLHFAGGAWGGLLSSPSVVGWWMDVPSAIMASSRNAGDAFNGEPLVLAFVELLVSVPVTLALFFAIFFLRSRDPFRSRANAIARFFTKSGLGPVLKGRAVVASADARRRMEAAHREFLPAALELVETPPSPIVVALLWFICLGLSSVLAWSYFGHLDIYATASGKIQPRGGSKIVQPLLPGKVIAMHVENGSHVKAGDLLIELDPTETAADKTAQALELQATRAEIARREVAVAIARSDTLALRPIPFDESLGDVLRDREEHVLAADVAHLVSTRDSLEAQLREAVARYDHTTMTVAARNGLLAVLKERVDVRNEIDTQSGGYRARVLDAMQEYEREKTNLASDQGELIEVQAAKNSAKAKIDEAMAQFIAEQTAKLAEAQRKRDGLVQDLIKATEKETQTRLTAPIDGMVQQLSVTTVGQVVASGQSLMTIVPDDAPIEIEAMILNRDIGFVKVGQPVTIKVDAFPFTRYGTLDGTVTTISHDGVDQKTAANLSDAASLTRPQGAPTSANAATAETLAFPARITISRETIDVDGDKIRLRPGMSVSAEVKTGQRRAIDYVLSPLREIQSASLQER
ncbi:HlyD family type I secretion periplasmic adaptor subunit [Hyphomicrobium sp.]|uniref:HlyD family type I secretion periplasmic adaptor subunit n=1 Tax=Hyphomicrobium sp. TaxID=82 RepID=UPI001DFFD250|nr:HlyD family type I secretion periplasmic adaptor subunit [Hyphomicrobium sp.]MBY0561640.1 HlyD family type I secretion periplasmic adaptor subunit [Hyphomicrobium sp.]